MEQHPNDYKPKRSNQEYEPIYQPERNPYPKPSQKQQPPPPPPQRQQEYRQPPQQRKGNGFEERSIKEVNR